VDDSRVDIERRAREAVPRGAPPRGTGTVAAILPNGRTVWLRVAPRLAPAAAANHLALLAEQSARWRGAAIDANGHAIGRLSRHVVDDTERLTDAHLDRARALRRRILAGDVKVDRKLAHAVARHRSHLERQMRIERESVSRLARRDFWDQLVILTAYPLFAAYGQRGSPFAANNLALLFILLIWIVGDEIVDALFGSAEKSPYALSDTDVWSYIAPLGNLLSGWWLLDDFQHERFITGVTAVPLEDKRPVVEGATRVYTYRFEAELRDRIGASHFEDFERFTGVTVVATTVSLQFSAAAQAVNARLRGVGVQVEEGELVLSPTVVTDPPVGPPPLDLGSVTVAWMLDTQKPATAISG